MKIVWVTWMLCKGHQWKTSALCVCLKEVTFPFCFLVPLRSRLQLCEEYSHSFSTTQKNRSVKFPVAVCLLPLAECYFMCSSVGQELLVSAPEPVGTAGIKRAAFLPLYTQFGVTEGSAGGLVVCFSRWTQGSRWIAWGVLHHSGWLQVWLDTSEIPELLSSQPCLCVLQHQSPGNWGY